jgi:signal transduction histidine kinase
MRSTDTSITADWLAVSLRWIFLTAMIGALSLGEKLLILPNIILVILAGWNVTLSIMCGAGKRMPFHREICLAADIVLPGTYFILGGGFLNPAFWFIMLPLLTGAIYFGIVGVLLTAGLMTTIQVVRTLGQKPDSMGLIILGVSVLFTFLLAGVCGSLSIRYNSKNRWLSKTKREIQQEMQRNRTRVDSERLRAIYTLTSTLLNTLNYERVLESVLDLSLSALNKDANAPADERLICAVLLFGKDGTMTVGSARRFTPADMRATLDGRQGAVAQSLDQDKPVLLKDVKNDPELTRFVSFQKSKEIYCFPLRSGFNAYGILLFGHPEPGYFASDRRDIIDILGRQAVIGIQNARLYQDVVDEREHMIEFQEEARRKLARDLHDGPTQSLAAIAMRVSLAQHMLPKDTKAAGEELVKIEEMARRTTKEIRHMLFTLRPLVLESQGLTAALQAMAEKMKETYSQNLSISVQENTLQNLELGKQSVIFYIVEEAVNNARKHAQAKHIWVTIKDFEKDIALLEVRDDGIGFDVDAVNREYDQRGSLGLINLNERTELISGVLDIKSVMGKGTQVLVYLPLTEEATDRLHHAGKR